MKNRSFLSIILAFACITMFAQYAEWNLENSIAFEGNWSVAENWRDAKMPDATMKTRFNLPNAADCIISDSANVKQLVIGDGTNNGAPLFIKDGGVLTTHNKELAWSTIGYNMGGELIIESGGILNSAHRFHLGLVSPKEPSLCILEVAGTLNTPEFSVNPFGHAGWTCKVYVDCSGEINTSELFIGEGGVLDVRGFGHVRIAGDVKSEMEALVASGAITAEGGDVSVDIHWLIIGEGSEADTSTWLLPDITPYVLPPREAANEALADIKIYPNPAKDHVYIKALDVNRLAAYRIIIADMKGSRVYENTFHTEIMQVKLSDWSGSGLYIVQLIDKHGCTVYTKKILLE